jgi:hypothetical protein
MTRRAAGGSLRSEVGSVRLEDHEADIVASFSRDENGDKCTKTGKERTIELTDLVVEVLTTAWRLEQLKENAAVRPQTPSVRVHQQPRHPHAPGRVDRARICPDLSGVRDHRPQSVRPAIYVCHDALDGGLRPVAVGEPDDWPQAPRDHPTTSSTGLLDLPLQRHSG